MYKLVRCRSHFTYRGYF